MGRAERGAQRQRLAVHAGRGHHAPRTTNRGRTRGAGARDPSGSLRPLMRAAAAVTPRSLVGGPSLTKTGVVLGGGLLLLLIAGTAAVALGSVGVGIGDTVAILGHRLLGVPAQVTWSVPAEQIIMEVRLPRVLTAM